MERKECCICENEIPGEENWVWNNGVAHKLCVIDRAKMTCDEMCCFDIILPIRTPEELECECGSSLKVLTEREKTALRR